MYDDDDDDDSGGLTSTLLGLAGSAVNSGILGGTPAYGADAPLTSSYAAQSTTGGNGLLILLGVVAALIAGYVLFFNKK